MKLAKPLIAIVLVSILLTACGQATPTAEATAIPTVLADTAIITEARLEPIRYAELALNANGLVSEVLVKEGDRVEAGQVIARLESSEARTLEAAQADAAQELTTAYQAVRDAQFKLDNFDVPSDFNDMTPTEAVAMTLEKLNTARTNYEPYKHLGQSNDGRREAKRRLDDAWADYRKAIQWMELESTVEGANARLTQAQNDYNALQDPSFAENTAGARAALANAEVRAPFAGVITSLDLKVGEFASAGQPVVTIADVSRWVVKTTDLTEIDVVELAEGDPATVTFDALPDVELKGNILSISQNFSQNQGDIVYEVTILLTDKNPAMRWGMTAAVKFE
ncbi:MAG: HlyD family efflux transporter periplasmic adaptor subunit [Chloroflexota bacterium]